MVCQLCNGKGNIYIPALGKLEKCPSCRKSDDWENKEVIDNVETNLSKYERLLIPEYYRGIDIEGVDTFIESLSVLGQFYTIDSINRMERILNRLWGDVYNGRYVKASLYLYVSNYVDMKQYVYSFQKLADSKGLRVVPYISANLLYGLQKARDVNIYGLLNGYGDKKDLSSDMLLANDGFNLIKDTGYTYYDYISSDICFIETTANTTDKGWIGLADLLNERAKKGLPTYVIGYYHSENAYIGNGKFLFKPEGLRNRLDLLIPCNLEFKGNKYHSNKQQNNIGNLNNFINLNISSKDILED